jgi:catechol 2,3-dioxygenase-like lactoylglutathione lyase family enzyme
MLQSTHLIAFIATTNPDHAKAFYQDTLGLRLLSDDPFAILFDSNGTRLRVQKLAELVPQPFTVLGWRVPSVRETVSHLSQRGVSFERFPSLDQDALGIWQAPSGARVAWFKDPDGNLLSVTQAGAA